MYGNSIWDCNKPALYMYTFWENIYSYRAPLHRKERPWGLLNKLPSATDTKEEHCTTMRRRDRGRRNCGEVAVSGNADIIISTWLCMYPLMEAARRGWILNRCTSLMKFFANAKFCQSIRNFLKFSIFAKMEKGIFVSTQEESYLPLYTQQYNSKYT
jgi:hypothetical protein